MNDEESTKEDYMSDIETSEKVCMSDEDTLKQCYKDEVYDLYTESVTRFGCNHPLPPKLLDFFMKEGGIELPFSVDAEVRRILGSEAVEPRNKSSNHSDTSESLSSEHFRNQTKVPAPQIYNVVHKIPPGPFKGTFASHLGLFVPVRDLEENLESFGEGDEKYMWESSGRAIHLAGLAQRNLRHSVSEYTWEADVREQVFKQMKEDVRISMDKRIMYFKDKNPKTSEVSVKERTPDMTFGLRTLSDEYLQSISTVKRKSQPFKNGSKPSNYDDDVYRAGWKEDITAILVQERLMTQMKDPRCGLVVDAKWGEADMIFPWGIYEAKKKSELLAAAEKQTFLAAGVYLDMLDKLARKPTAPHEYQDGTPEHFQIFGFISCAQLLKVYVIYDFFGEVLGESIWEGDMTKSRDAFELIFIFDQIKEYAVTTHRNFVLKHLEPWVLHAESAYQPTEDKVDADDVSMGNSDAGNLGLDQDSSQKLPEWRQLLDDYHSRRSIKGKKTRLAKKQKTGKKKQRRR